MTSYDSEPHSGQSNAEALHEEAPEVSIMVGKWVVGKYDEVRYPSEVARVNKTPNMKSG